MGSLRDFTGGYSGGLLVLAGALIIEAILVSILKLPDAPSKTPAIAEPQPAVGGPRSVAGRACADDSRPLPRGIGALSGTGVIRWPVIFNRRSGGPENHCFLRCLPRSSIQAPRSRPSALSREGGFEGR